MLLSDITVLIEPAIGQNVGMSKSDPDAGNTETGASDGMEPQRFRPKRWVRFLQTGTGALVVFMGASSFSAPDGSALVGVLAFAIGLFTLGQGTFAEVVATEDDLRVRRNIWRPVLIPWETVDFALKGNPLALRLVSGKTVRLIPLLEDAQELRDMIDDTVGPPPSSASREERQRRPNRRQ